MKARIHDFSHIHNKLLELERWFRNHVDFETYLGLDFDEDETDRHRRSTEKKKQDRFKIIEPARFDRDFSGLLERLDFRTDRSVREQLGNIH